MTIPTTDPILTPGTPFADAVAAVRAGTPLDDAVAGLIAQLKVSEMLGLLDGDVPVREGLPAMSKEYNAVPVEAGRVDRLGIPGIRFTDGPRGVVTHPSCHWTRRRWGGSPSSDTWRTRRISGTSGPRRCTRRRRCRCWRGCGSGWETGS